MSRQLVSDVSVASYLSGGIDSGSITAVAAKQIPHMRSFTVGFDIRSASGLELQFDEREAAEYMSYLFGTEHYEMVLKAGDMVRCLPGLIRRFWAGLAATNCSLGIRGATIAPHPKATSIITSSLTIRFGIG